MIGRVRVCGVPDRDCGLTRDEESSLARNCEHYRLNKQRSLFLTREGEGAPESIGFERSRGKLCSTSSMVALNSQRLAAEACFVLLQLRRHFLHSRERRPPLLGTSSPVAGKSSYSRGAVRLPRTCANISTNPLPRQRGSE